MTTEVMRAFGVEVAQARSREGMTMADLAEAAFGNPDRKGYIGQIEKGRKNLRAETIDRLVVALNLPQDVHKAALMAPAPEPDPVEEKTDRDAESLLRKVSKDASAPVTAERLLVDLAYEHAAGPHRDLFDAYTSLRRALEAADEIKRSGAMPHNADSALQATMAEVARLNDEGRRDEAADFLKQDRKRREQVEETYLDLELKQDRLMNRPDLAAKRIVQDLRRKAPPGGIFWETVNKGNDWGDYAQEKGDLFARYVALELAKLNAAGPGKKPKHRANALQDLAIKHLILALVSSKPEHFRIAKSSNIQARRLLPQSAPQAQRAEFGRVHADIRLEEGERSGRPKLVEEAVGLLQVLLNEAEARGLNEELTVKLKVRLASALRALSKHTRNSDHVTYAIEQLYPGLIPSGDVDQAWLDNDEAVANILLGRLDARIDTLARAYDLLTSSDFRNRETTQPFNWAIHQWNLADLSLAYYEVIGDPSHLPTARHHVNLAREVFVEGSEYQTQRCDELIAEIDAAEG
ncbi:MAG: helix-turn-helix domain-containing protein [Shimia sp.]